MPLSFDPDLIEVPSGQHIGGSFVDLPGEEIVVLRPSDEKPMGTITDGGSEAVDMAVAAASKALDECGWAVMNPRDRAKALFAFAEKIEEKAEYLGRLEAMGSSRLVSGTVTGDAVRTAAVVRYFAEYCDKLEGIVTATKANTLSYTRRQPYGIAGAIVPWNFPMITAAWKFAPALAAGNAVVMKTSELTPHSLLALAECAAEAGLPGGLFNVVNGWGHSTGAAIVSHPAIGIVSFTGSTSTGAAIMSLAAQSGIKPVVLELGGKSPQIVTGDPGDMETVATRVANAFMANAGQVCTLASRLIVQRSVADELVSRVLAKTQQIKAGPTWDETTTFAPVISAKQFSRIDALVAETVKQGGEVLTGGRRLEGPNSGNFYAPTVLANVTRDNIGFTDEFFGPVMNVTPYDEIEEAIAEAQHPTYGLSASIHTQDLKLAMKVADAVEAGMVWVNQHGRDPEFSYTAGGWKGSGFGKDMGRAGFEAFTREKAVWINYL
jgi:aldehyde dehydrogenase (NAD+)